MACLNAVYGGGDGDGDSNGGDFPSVGSFWNGVVEVYWNVGYVVGLTTVIWSIFKHLSVTLALNKEF